MTHRFYDARPGALLETIELQRVGCEMAGSDLYARILAAVAADVGDGGPCRDLLAPWESAPIGDAVLLRLLAAIHELVLAGAVPELAAHYPSVGGTPHRGVGPAFITAVQDRRTELAAAMVRGVQTNEVGRSAALLCGFVRAASGGMPLRIFEIGASAGLNLLFDRFHYRSGGWALGPADSPVRFHEPYVGRPPEATGLPSVAARRGCDLDPIDGGSLEGARRLRSYIWPDQLERLHRLDAAIEVVEENPVVVDRAEAVGWLQDQVSEPVEGVVTVAVHSIMFQYLSMADRARLLSVIDEAGSRSTSAAPFAWLRMEPGGDQAEVRLTTWPGGATAVVARSGYHGPPVTTT